MTIQDEISQMLGQFVAVEGKNNELYVSITREELQRAIPFLSSNSFELVSLFCVENFDNSSGFTLFYVFEKAGFKQPLVIQVDLSGIEGVSIAKTYPSACWYEREVTDGFGIQFQDAFDTRRLFLHETYPIGIPSTAQILQKQQNHNRRIQQPKRVPIQTGDRRRRLPNTRRTSARRHHRTGAFPFQRNRRNHLQP